MGAILPLEHVVERTGAEIKPINARKQGARHLVFHQDEGLACHIAHADQMIPGPRLGNAGFAQDGGILPLCAEDLRAMGQAENLHLLGKAELAMDEPPPGIRTMDEGALAADTLDVAILNERLAGRLNHWAGNAQTGAELLLRGQLLALGQLMAGNGLHQLCPKLLVQRDGALLINVQLLQVHSAVPPMLRFLPVPA